MAPKVEGKGKGKAVAVSSSRSTRSMDRKTRSAGNSAGSSSSKLMNFESPEKRKRKSTEKEGGAKKKTKKEEEEESTEDDDDSETKKIVIEHCKQCTSFRTRAKQVKEGLEKAVPGILVTVNADKPRRGCFEIRQEGGQTFISLLDMKRPFTPMKELDMDQVIADIVEIVK